MFPGCENFSGYCARCQQTHSLAVGPALEAARQLMEELEQHRRLDFEVAPDQANPQWSTESLFGEPRGKMFGVLVGEKPDGTRQTLKAFSGIFAGSWEIPGWVPPLFDVQKFWQLIEPVDIEINALGREIKELESSSSQRSQLVARRKKLSQGLMKEIHRLYKLNNFQGKKMGLDHFSGPQALPTGTGDCCAPKLLNHAATHDLKPVGIAEFFWGRTNRSATKQHRQFYPPCESNCGPILGYLLCGVTELNDA